MARQLETAPHSIVPQELFEETDASTQGEAKAVEPNLQLKDVTPEEMGFAHFFSGVLQLFVPTLNTRKFDSGTINHLKRQLDDVLRTVENAVGRLEEFSYEPDENGNRFAQGFTFQPLEKGETTLEQSLVARKLQRLYLTYYYNCLRNPEVGQTESSQVTAIVRNFIRQLFLDNIIDVGSGIVEQKTYEGLRGQIEEVSDE